MGLMCEPAWKGALLGSIALFGSLVTMPFLPYLSDKYGRKWFWVGGHVFEVVCYSVLLFTTSWTVMIVVMAGFGLTTTTRLIVGFTYLTEIFPKNRQVAVVTINLVENSVVYILGTIYFWQISTNWFYFDLLGYIVSVVTCILAFFIPESPRFLLAHGKVEETKKAINLIARLNFKPPIDWSKVDMNAAKSDKE